MRLRRSSSSRIRRRCSKCGAMLGLRLLRLLLVAVLLELLVDLLRLVVLLVVLLLPHYEGCSSGALPWRQ